MRLTLIPFAAMAVLPITAQDHRTAGWPHVGNGQVSSRGACDTLRLFPHPHVFPTGMAVRGERLWIGSLDQAHIYAYDLSGTIVDSLATPNGLNDQCGGLTLHDGTLWAVMEESELVVQYDLTTHQIIDQWSAPGNDNIWGIEFFEGSIWLSNYDQLGGTALYKCDPATLVPLDTLALVGTDILELEVSGNDLLGLAPGTQTLYRIDTETGVLGPSWPWCLPYPLGVDAMGGTTLSVSSAYFATGLQAVFEYGQNPLGVRPSSDTGGRALVYPVPADDHLNVVFDVPASQLTVSAPDGRTILEQNDFRSGTPVDVRGLVPGTYVLTLRVSGKTWSGRFVVVR